MCNMMNGGCGCLAAKTANYLVLVGALNWGLVGAGQLFQRDWNFVHMVFSIAPMWAESAVYLIVGIAAVAAIIGCRCATCKACHANTPAA